MIVEDSMIEYAVLGSVINNPNLIPMLVTKVAPADMWEPRAETTLKAIIDLWADSTPVDALSVAQKVSGTRVTASDVFDMVEQACPPASLPHHLDTILERATVRRLGIAGQQITSMASGGESSAQIAQHAQELLDGAIRADSTEVNKVGDTLAATLEKMEAASRGEQDSGLPTGFHDLDRIINGLAGGQMIIVAARPGTGKTTLAVDFLRNASIANGVPSLMFSLEMAQNELNQRILAAEAHVPLTNIVTGQLQAEEWSRVADAASRIEDAPLYVDDSSETTITDITAKARMFVERRGVGLIVVDYLQLLRSKEKSESREQEIASYSRQMKLLAKSCNVPVVVIAQLNRESVRRGGAPMVSDLRESGALEQDADVILLIDRPDALDPNDARAGEADVVVGKNRRGRTGTATLVSQLKYSRFSNIGRL